MSQKSLACTLSEYGKESFIYVIKYILDVCDNIAIWISLRKKVKYLEDILEVKYGSVVSESYLVHTEHLKLNISDCIIAILILISCKYQH